MSAGSGVEIDRCALPIINGAADLATGGTVPGGTLNNKSYVAPHVSWGHGVSETDRILACDAQTSGGLLVAVAREEADDAVKALHDAGVESAAVIGRFVREGSGWIVVH